MPDAIAELGLDTAPFSKALSDVNAEMADLLIESNKLNAEIALLERQMFNAGKATKEQVKNLREMKTVAEDFTEQIKQAKDQQQAFSKATEQTIEPVSKLGAGVSKLIGAFTGLYVFHQLARGFVEATDEAIKLQEAIDKLTTPNLNASFVSESDLKKQLSGLEQLRQKVLDTKSVLEQGIETHLPVIHDLFYSGEEAKRQEQLNEIKKKEVEIDKELAQKADEQNQILALKINHQDYEAELLKNQLHYQELIADAISKGDVELSKSLKTQEEITAELIKQKNIEAQKKTTSAIAGDEAKQAIGAILGDQRNQEKIDDREADRQQSDLDFFHEEERKSGERALAYKAKQDKEESDFFHKQEHEMGLRALRFAEEQQKKEQRQREQQNAIRDQQTVSGVRRQDGPIAAQREAISQGFDAKIQDALRRGDDVTADLLKKQQNDALAGLDAAQANQTPAQHRAEVRATEREARNEAHARDRNADLDDRIARGARGSEHSRIEERRRQNQRDAERAKNQDAARHAQKADTEKGYGATDRGYLKSIADALTPKD